jgi:hypothetical protein
MMSSSSRAKSLDFFSSAVEVSVLWNIALCCWVVGAQWFSTTMVFQNMRSQSSSDLTPHPEE